MLVVFQETSKKVLVYILLNIGSGHSKKINKKRYNKSFCLEKFLYKLLKYHLLSLVLSRAEGKYFDIFENPLAFFYIIAIMFSWARSERQGIFLWRPFYGTE